MARKGENIYKRKDGRWEGRYIKSRRIDRSPRFGYVYAQTFREVREKLLLKKQQYSYLTQMTKTIYQGSVTDWVYEWLEGSVTKTVKPSTYASYRHKLTSYVCPYFEEIPLHELTQATIQEFADSLHEKGLSVNTIKTVLQILKRSLREAIHREYLSIDPIHDIIYSEEAKKKITALSEVAQQRIEEEATHYAKGLPILIALHTGLRIGEISALKWRDVNLETGELTVTRTLQRIPCAKTKNSTIVTEGVAKSGSAQRIIPLNQKIWTLLKEKKKQATSPYVVGYNNRFCEPRTINYQFKRILEKLDLASYRFHQLRHTFATRLLEKGADIASVSALLGHHSAKMTLDVYVDSLMTQRKKWVNQLV
ncbi:hypothetical protein BAU15_05615 [Enterococcus sp. JM4C]|uniref:tyrosine-type recombinase/integrase n=1 Tax=Candidatus Enterococcus huntleyi TaxID=1857217 RepID=UPI00137A16FF|nr:site-specific integrase [Enterococcus sp. JM4C]KAF1295226.1 hypothetical protein BAU15_05615 [Enterococcus sp. JM4C]